MNKVFHALASPVRRQLLDIVVDKPGCPVGETCKTFDMSRIAVMKHLAVLEDAGLLLSERDGRTRRLYFNAVPIQQVYERWTDQYAATWAGGLTAFKNQVETAG